MEIPIVRCDSAIVFQDATITGDAIEFGEPNSEYQYLSAFPLVEDGSFVAVVSKDLHEWVICVGAYVDGGKFDVRGFAHQIQELAKMEG